MQYIYMYNAKYTCLKICYIIMITCTFICYRLLLDTLYMIIKKLFLICMIYILIQLLHLDITVLSCLPLEKYEPELLDITFLRSVRGVEIISRKSINTSIIIKCLRSESANSCRCLASKIGR